MKYQSHSIHNTVPLLPFKTNQTYYVNVFDRISAFVLLIALAPLIALNILVALFKGDSIFLALPKQDALGRVLEIHHFKHGPLRKVAMLFDVLYGRLSFCGVSITHSLSPYSQKEILSQYASSPGVFSLFDLRESTGISIESKEALLLEQLNYSFVQRGSLFIKSILCLCFYSPNKKILLSSNKMPLFGLTITNSTMVDATRWVISTHNKNTPKVGFYVNAHSINLGVKQKDFIHTLQQADALFVDGSGMRMAAKSAGYQLKDNNNGTDMLPHICTSCVEQGKSLYLLGAQLGIAKITAENLVKQYPGLIIAGYQHGYTSKAEHQTVINQINDSDCDILLVAMGSPAQESWILENRNVLQCQTALAVGGLFDFYSGQISRSPLWLRELGLEWVWRLIQEPQGKFTRYVWGNPLFLFRIHCLGLAKKGV